MRLWQHLASIGLLAAGFLAMAPAALQADQFFGPDVGIISATVEKTDSERGLAIRSTPSAQGAPKAYLPVGTEVKGYAAFQNGYVKLLSPMEGGWLSMSHLKPVGGEATVASVDKPDLCLRIRGGPASSYDKVGCAELGSKLELTGFWSAGNWAQVKTPVSGWVYAKQIDSDLMPPTTTTYASSTRSSSPSSYSSNRSDLTSGVYQDTDDDLWYNERRHREWRRHRKYGDGVYHDGGWNSNHPFGGGGIKFNVHFGGGKKK